MTPSDNAIEACLRKVVHDARKADDEVTVNVARQRTEEELDLEEGFLKTDTRWKNKSKAIVQSAFEEDLDTVSSAAASPEPEPKIKPKPQAKAGVKRKAQHSEPAKKRRKQSPVDDLDQVALSKEDEASPQQDSDVSDASDEFVEDDSPAPPSRKSASRPETKAKALARSSAKKKTSGAKSAAGRGKRNVAPGSDDEDELEQSEPSETKDDNDVSGLDTPADNGDDTVSKVESNPVVKDDDGDDSDMSVLIDDPPPKKARQKKAASSKPASKAKGKAAAKPAKEVAPEDEEIKRLQGWLVKCGLRKVWSRELAPFSTPKEKIKHLKKSLENVGMTGRYSAEKAQSIKEARELQAEIESAQEFNQVFGHKGSDDDDEDGSDVGQSKTTTRLRRALPKGFIDFGDSGDDGSD